MSAGEWANAKRAEANRQIVCGQFNPAEAEMTVNLANLDLNDRADCLNLLIHELAHHYVRSHDHLSCEFVDACTVLRGRLAMLALQEPGLFTAYTAEEVCV